MLEHPESPVSHLPHEGPTVSRREMVGGGMLALGTFLISGCASSGGGAGGLSSKLASSADASNVRTWADSERSMSEADGYAAPPLPSTPTWTPQPAPSNPVRPPVRAAALGPVQIMPRSSWTRQGVARPREIYPIGRVLRITVHHDGMPPASIRSPRDAAARLEQIRSAHVHGRAWADIGYHFIVDPSGRVWEGRSAGFQGAHVRDQNENNLGILVLGNFQVQRPTPAALASLDRLLAMQMQRHGVPVSRVRTHRELARTECPGNNLQLYMTRTRTTGALASMVAPIGLA